MIEVELKKDVKPVTVDSVTAGHIVSVASSGNHYIVLSCGSLFHRASGSFTVYALDLEDCLATCLNDSTLVYDLGKAKVSLA